MPAPGHLVIGMNLYAQVALGIDEFHQQGQFAAVFLVDLLSENLVGILVNHSNQALSLPFPIADDTTAIGYSTHLPTLANGFVGWL
jgi:hypothetical protein